MRARRLLTVLLVVVSGAFGYIANGLFGTDASAANMQVHRCFSPTNDVTVGVHNLTGKTMTFKTTTLTYDGTPGGLADMIVAGGGMSTMNAVDFARITVRAPGAFLLNGYSEAATNPDTRYAITCK